MSGRAVGWAFDREGLSPAQKLVLVALADNASDDGTCWPSQRTLATKTGLANRTVRYALQALEERGIVARQHRMRLEGKGRTSDLYWLAVNQPATDATSDLPATGDTTKRQLTTDLPATGAYQEPSENLQQEPTPLKPPTAEEFEDWLDHYREVTGRPARGSASARRAFAARRRERWSLDDLKLATIGCHADPWRREQGHDVPDTILRVSKVEGYRLVGLAVEASEPDGRRKLGELVETAA